MFKAFVSACAASFHTTNGQNKTLRFDNEGFVPVASLCSVVGSPSNSPSVLLLEPEIYDRS